MTFQVYNVRVARTTSITKKGFVPNLDGETGCHKAIVVGCHVAYFMRNTHICVNF